MPAPGCPLPVVQQPAGCKNCPLPVAEKEQKCKWYRGTVRALSPLRISVVSNGVLLLAFAITVLAQKGLTVMQKDIAMVSLFVSAALAVCAILPRRIGLLSNVWIIVSVTSLVYIAWFYTFAMKWLEGMKNTSDFEQCLISVLGIIWLFCLLMVLIRSLTIVTADRRLTKWIPFVIPVWLLWPTISIFREGDPIGGGVMILFIVGSIVISLQWWKPAGELLIGTSR